MSLLVCSKDASAVDEIQVYDGSIAEVGQFTLQQHLNYAFSGRKEPDFRGGLVSNRSLNGTPELAYGVTDWYEVGLYAPFALDKNAAFLGDGVKIRHLFVTPGADERAIFYGVNVELSYSSPRFSQSRFGLEIRPIIGVRKNDWEFIVNPIVEVGFGREGEARFTPAFRVARKLDKDVAVGVEYYTDLGRFGRLAPFDKQQQAVFGVVDFKLGKLDVNLGLGYGLTKASDRLVGKTIFGIAF